jgi:glycosyltransferase involved in cell wall biosynthesis
MACGCPVACSDAGALPEVCGDAARYFHPDDPRQIAAAVRDVMADPEEWAARGVARAGAFTWDASARAHEDAFHELV